MLNPVDTDLVVKHVKNIVDNCRCAICDKLEGSRVRYSCGHITCTNCQETTLDCSLCIFPTNNSPNKPVPDDLATTRISNVSALLTTCQKAFNVDVNKRHKVLEQLKIERELFPQCIQAPVKYCNKKRVSNIENKNKTVRYSRVYFPGEAISSVKEMDKSNKKMYVEKWLATNKEIKPVIKNRKPFSDINIQDFATSTPLKRKTTIGSNKSKENTSVNKRKRSSLTNNDVTCNKAKRLRKSDKEESGIVIDVEMDDSHSNIIDKDKLACMLVVEADKRQLDSKMEEGANEIFNSKSKKCLNKKVPFYKMSSLVEGYKNCQQCNFNEIGDYNNVTITFQNTKTSNSVQTDLSMIDYSKVDFLDKEEELKYNAIKDNRILSQDIFSEDIKVVQSLPETSKESGFDVSQVIIEESSSDSDFIQVPNYILTEVQVHDEPKPRRGVRRLSPESNDSSEKENYNPNKGKRMKTKKKKMLK